MQRVMFYLISAFPLITIFVDMITHSSSCFCVLTVLHFCSVIHLVIQEYASAQHHLIAQYFHELEAIYRSFHLRVELFI